ncbi:MAG: hypothetical protein H6730_08015 [Deltaproteobacteria bacterium]|nr:hypothetical protein [Deltaproteobacteria bacterium]
MFVRSLRALAPLALLSALGCGDIGRVVLDVTFPSEDVELRTRALRVFTRQAPTDGSDGCAALWSTVPTGLAQNDNILAYPNRVDMVVSRVNLANPVNSEPPPTSPALSFLVYAYPTIDVATSEPLAGGCAQLDVDPNVTQEISIELAVP